MSDEPTLPGGAALPATPPPTSSSEAPTIVDARAVAAAEEAGTPDAPRRIGGYTIVRVLGEGGMGTVYEAQQQHPKRTVALKVIRASYLSPTLLRRFEHESSVLARLQHPGIAQVYEAGTVADERGRSVPFFAMEYIRGQPLNIFAETRRLGTRERLDLIAKVCDAVEHAHQKGVIHRDLKPGNILVAEGGASTQAGTVQAGPSGAGQPKILDFGVARATNSDIQQTTMHTDVGQLVGTVPYMSPEQIGGDPSELDTRSDVYALGVIAYELLAGRLPYAVTGKMVHEVARIIRMDEPTRLSVVQKQLRGDVETIISKALEKDKTRRYQSAEAFANDIRRYLRDETIAARPASTWYQLRKFSRRNRGLVYGVVAAFALLVAGVIATGLALGRALRAERTSQARLAESEATVKFLDDMLGAADPSAKGKDVSVRAVLDESAKSIDAKFAGRPLVAARLHGTIGRTYAALGLFDQAAPHLKANADLRAAQQGPEHPDTRAALNDVLSLLTYTGRIEEAEKAFGGALEANTRLLGRTHAVTLRTIEALANVYIEQRRSSEAEALLTELVSARETVSGRESLELAQALNLLASCLGDERRFDEAQKVFERALGIQTKALGVDHPDTLQTRINMVWMQYWTVLPLKSKAPDEFRSQLEAQARLGEAVLADCTRVLGEEHMATLNASGNLARVYNELKEYDKADALRLKELAISVRTLGEEHPDTIVSLTNFGNSLRLRARYVEAIPYLERALKAARATLPPGHEGVAYAMGGLGTCFRETGRFEEAEPLMLEAYEIITKASTPDSGIVRQMAIGLTDLYEMWEKAQPGQGHAAKAVEWKAKASAERGKEP